MKRISIILLVAVALSHISFSQEKGLGVGFSFGMPTGISLKAWLTRTTAIQGGIGWNQYHNTYFTVEYLEHSLNAIRSTERFPLFYGGGVVLGNSNVFGVRGVFGIAWCSRSAPIDVFLQITPVLYLNPSSDFDIDGAIGVRYFF